MTMLSASTQSTNSAIGKKIKPPTITMTPTTYPVTTSQRDSSPALPPATDVVRTRRPADAAPNTSSAPNPRLVKVRMMSASRGTGLSPTGRDGPLSEGERGDHGDERDPARE